MDGWCETGRRTRRGREKESWDQTDGTDLREAVDAARLKVPVAGVVRHGRHAPLREALLDDGLHVVGHGGELVLVQGEVRELVALGGLCM